MRLIITVAIAALPWLALAAPTWQVISSEPGKRIELDRTGIKQEEGGKVLALGRLVLDKGIIDMPSGNNYHVIEILTRYECATRNAATVKRVYKKDENEIIREEEIKGVNLLVKAGTLEDKVLREVCRPGHSRADALDLAKNAGLASESLRAANESLVKKELARAGIVKTGAEHATPPAQETPKTASSSHHAPTKAASKRHKPTAAHVSEEAHAHVHWSYEGLGGPENWHKLDEKNRVCATGRRQSPIDINDGIKVDLEPIRFDYRPSLFRIVDNGHTIQVAVGGGSLTVTGKTYELQQFHFHKPSEEKVEGKRFDMVAHLVHKSDDGQLAVVAVLMEKGGENTLIQTLWNNLPLEKNVTVSPPGVSVDLNTFLPSNRSYYTYMGSLTTPPCSEGVLWMVLKQAVAISPTQIDIFSRLYRHNARPIQATADRLIKEGR